MSERTQPANADDDDEPSAPQSLPDLPKRRPRSKSDARAEQNARRRQARELALQILYEVDVTDHSLAEVMARTRAQHSISEVTLDYLGQLLGGIEVNRETIDTYIGEAAPAFPVGQMPAVDRSVLRVAVLELMVITEVPPKAAINEAVELAKTFGGDNSGRFVNGVLGTIHRRLTAERATPAT